jgi:RimJ/RimL family protein N-acetyltransferase
MGRVQRADVGDVDLVRTLRLRALADAPDAFGSTYEREVAFAPDVWTARLATRTNAHFLGRADEPVGIVSIVRDEPDGDPAWLVGMWVEPDARGSGVADELVATALEWAGNAHIGAVHLHVTDGNERAERLYLRHGFARTGASLRRERDGVTEHEMRHEIGSASP